MRALDQIIHTAAEMSFHGILIRNAEVRTKVLDDCHTVPVVCVEFMTSDDAHTPVIAEQAFKTNEYALAEKCAQLLRKGRAVYVRAPLVGVKLVAANATAISLDSLAELQPIAQERSNWATAL